MGKGPSADEKGGGGGGGGGGDWASARTVSIDSPDAFAGETTSRYEHNDVLK